MKKLLLMGFFALCSASSFAQTKCQALTLKKEPCMHKATDNGYCRQHNPKAVRCEGVTKSGTQCRNFPQKNGKYCHIHVKTSK